MARASGEGRARLEVCEAEAGARLDVFLARRLGLSRADARALLARGAVALDGRIAELAAKGLALEAGARVDVMGAAPRAAQRPAAEPELGFAVLAEGPGWLVLDKPAGVPVHPLAEDERGTLLNFAVARHPEMLGIGEGGLRSGVVHRLDVDTSGCLALAISEPAWRRLREAFRRHRVSKTYRAIALGALRERGELELPLVVARHRPARVRAALPGERGARATRLAWRVRERLRGAVLVEVDLETGFLHQVRATLAHLGAPLAGDRLYGPPAEGDPSGAARQMLHAARLSYAELSAESPDPPDFREVLDRLRGA